MNKRYQVFLSSTYADLKEERQKVIQALMEMDCIPSGMELFPAMDEEQFNFIKSIIDDCDYYILIIGGRYGSITSDGVSYTQLEYEYAISKGLKVIAFLHKDPDLIPKGKTDKDPTLETKLQKFRDEVAKSRMVKFWTSAEELPGLVALSLSKTIKAYPALGWVRASESSNPELLSELHTLRKELDEVKRKNIELEKNNVVQSFENIADLQEGIDLSGIYKPALGYNEKEFKVNLTWNQIFAFISPYLLENPNETKVNSTLTKLIHQKIFSKEIYSGHINSDVLQTIKIQLIAYGLIEVSYSETTSKSMALFWAITPKGKELMMELRTIKTNKTI